MIVYTLVCLYVLACTCLGLYVCMYACMYSCMYACMDVCLFMFACMYVTYVRKYVCMYVCMYVHNPAPTFSRCQGTFRIHLLSREIRPTPIAEASRRCPAVTNLHVRRAAEDRETLPSSRFVSSVDGKFTVSTFGDSRPKRFGLIWCSVMNTFLDSWPSKATRRAGERSQRY